VLGKCTGLRKKDRAGGKAGGREGGREGGTTHLIKLIGGHHGEGRHDQVRRDAHPLLRLLPEVEEADLVIEALLVD